MDKIQEMELILKLPGLESMHPGIILKHTVQQYGRDKHVLNSRKTQVNVGASVVFEQLSVGLLGTKAIHSSVLTPYKTDNHTKL